MSHTGQSILKQLRLGAPGLAVTALFGLAAGCGQPPPPVAQTHLQNFQYCPGGGVYNPSTGTCSAGTGTGTTGPTNEFTNQSARPISPVMSQMGQTGTYSATVSATSPGRIRLNGQTQYSSEICVLPLVSNNTGSFQVLRNGAQIVRLCKVIPVTPTAEGLVFDFGTLQFNSIAVVEQPFLAALLAHIDFPSANPVPPYAVGSLR